MTTLNLPRPSFSIASASVFALLGATFVPQNVLALCSASEKSSGCVLPAHEAPMIPGTAAVLGGADKLSVSEFTGAVQVQATDVQLPWQGASAPHFTRTYHSNRLMIGQSGGVTADFPAHIGPLGLGWSFHYGVVWRNTNPTNPHRYTLLRGDGTRENYLDQIDGQLGLATVASSGETAYVSKSLSVLIASGPTAATIYIHHPDGVKWKMQLMSTLGVNCAGPRLCSGYVTTEVSDLSGNKWTVNYAADQAYLEHPVIDFVTDELMRSISFVYQNRENGGTGLRPMLSEVQQNGRAFQFRYAPIPGLDGHNFLDEVETPAGRITKFGWVTPSDPAVNEIGLIESVRSPLGGGVVLGWEYATRVVPQPYPTNVWVQEVRTLSYRPTSISSATDQILETYTYQQNPSTQTAPAHVQTTVTITGAAGLAATRVQRAFDYDSGFCSGPERVGLAYFSRIERGPEFIESLTQHDGGLLVSSRGPNPYCATGGTRVYRVSSSTSKDSSLAAGTSPSFDHTTTYQNYDLFSPQLVTSSPGTTISTTYANVVAQGRMQLGLPTSRSETFGADLLRKIGFVYNTAAQHTHLVREQKLFHTASAFDSVTLKYATGNGAKGAIEEATRGNVTETYTYTNGLLSKVERDGIRMERSSVTEEGTYSSELRDGISTVLSWDDDLRVTLLTTGTLPAVHVSYNSRNGATGNNWICVGKGAVCSSGGPPVEGGRRITFDGLGRKTSEQDLIGAGSFVEKAWSDFDYAGRPTEYEDPTRGTMTLAYDLAGRMISEKLGATMVTHFGREWDVSERKLTTTKEGLVLTDVDDWAGRPTYRGVDRESQGTQGLAYSWQLTGTGWRSTVGPSSAPGGNPAFDIAETYDLLGRLVSERRPEIGTVTHGYDARGFRVSSRLLGQQSGGDRCFDVNDHGLIEETYRSAGGCSGSRVSLRTATFYPDTQEPHVVTGKGTVFRTVDVRRTYGAAAADGLPKSLELKIPRALDAPAPWVGGEVFVVGPTALDDFRARDFAFTKVEEAEVDGFYEVEVRVVPSSSALMPSYDWSRAQEQCEAADTMARGKWTAPNSFTGQELEAHLEALTSGGAQPPPAFPWDLSPDTLYCWRARAVRCHDVAQTCAKQELGPSGTWGVFAFQNPQAQPVSRDGWLQELPTNRSLNAPDEVQACLSGNCPHRPIAINRDSVTLTAWRARDAGGRDTSWTFPNADTGLMDWARGGSTATYTRNGLGDVETIKFRFFGEAATSDRTLLSHTSYSDVGAPDAGTLQLFGYASGQPGNISTIQVNGGDVARAVDSQTSLALDWGYDGRGRLASWEVNQGADSILKYRQITYTSDSLVSRWTREDTGFSGATTFGVNYDERGQLDSFVHAPDSQGSPSNRVDFSFDSQGNLTGRANGMVVAGLNQFHYDGAGVQSTTDGAIALGASSLGAFDANNRSTAADVAYDSQGRLTQRDGRTFSYSNEDHLETVSGQLGMERQMVYDGEGNLVRLVAGAEVHYYLRDDTGRLIYEEVHDGWFYGPSFRDGDDNVVPHVRRYEYIYDEASHIATIEHADGVSSLSYALRDWRDFEAVTLDADEAFARHYHEPSPFGLEMRRSASEIATHAQLVAPHRQRLGIANLQHNGWRTIGADWGRFTIPDPARARHERLPQGLNLYANNLNNPMMYRDRDGQIAFLIPAAIIAYRVYSAYSTANDVVNAVEMVMDPNTSTEDVVAAGVTALAGVALGKAGGVAVKAGMRYGKGGVRRVVNMAAKRLRGKSCVTNSFAVGTLVALSTVASAVPIEGLEVGDRVATIAATSETQVDKTWGVVELELDIGRRVTLLRPPEWFAAHDLKVGERTMVAFSLGSDGLVTGVVRDLRPFKGPTKGQGRVVLATLEGVADELYSLTFEGVDAPLHATSEHPLYSLDRDTWVGVEELTVGERLQTAEGAVTIAALERERGAHRVLNIEVEGEHEYFVGDAEVRAHNPGCGPRNRDIGPSGKPKRHQVRYNTKKRMREAGSGSNRSKSSRRRGEPRRKKGVIDRHANSPTPSGAKWGGHTHSGGDGKPKVYHVFRKEGSASINE